MSAAVDAGDVTGAAVRQLPIARIRKHPLNPRRTATADAELVASVKEQGLLQPVVVAPVEGDDDRYVLIAGHRRVDAFRKAGFKNIPALVRGDLLTEQLQLEAMVVENVHRKDLTVSEEADAYAQLELFGMKPAAIATATGRDSKTVRDRLKTRALSKTTKSRIDKGQITVDQAVQLVSFADDPAATKRLEKAAGKPETSYSGFTYELKRELKFAEEARDIAVRIAELVELGAVETTDAALGHARYRHVLHQTFSDKPKAHKGCLAYIHEPTHTISGYVYGPSLTVVCLKPDSHTKQLEASEKEAARERAEAQAAREEAARERALAAEIRADLAMEHTATAKLPAPMVDLLRATLPAMLSCLLGNQREHSDTYQRLAEIPEAQRWATVSFYDAKAPGTVAFVDHCTDLATTATVPTLVRCLRALLAAVAEHAVDTGYYGSRNVPGVAAAWLDGLERMGHTPGDDEHRIRVAFDLTEEDQA